MNRLRQALARRLEWLWRGQDDERGVPGSITLNRENGRQGYRRDDDRRRFWAEFREGQRQAEKSCLEAKPLMPRDA
jgi:hypothetical protein